MAPCRVVITIDTETPQSPLFDGRVRENLMEASYEGRPLGVTRIIEELRAFNAKAVFFVNVYEAAMWGEQPLREMCERIAAAGHEIGLHTHPACRYDHQRHHMWEYSLDEQRGIVADGLALLHQWLGDRPIVSHRAGAYGANEDTITAIAEHGLSVDSSNFYGHPLCRLDWGRNQVTCRKGMLEVPVTWMTHDEAFTVAGRPVHHRPRQMKTDVDWAGYDELKFFVEEACANRLPVVNLSLHSYSFLRFDRRYSQFTPDAADLDRFHRFLQYAIIERKLSVLTLEQLLGVHRRSPAELEGPDYLPIWRTETPLWRGFARKLHHWVRGAC